MVRGMRSEPAGETPIPMRLSRILLPLAPLLGLLAFLVGVQLLSSAAAYVGDEVTGEATALSRPELLGSTTDF